MKHSDRGYERPDVSTQSLIRNQRGVTGLETAIILIAFVVVTSVVAFTVLLTGIFSAERGKETIHAGLKEARSSVHIRGSVVANGITDKNLSLGDTAWTATSMVAENTADTTDKKEGTASADLTITSTSTTGLAAYDDLSSAVDLSSMDSIRLWAKSSATSSFGDLEAGYAAKHQHRQRLVN